MEEHHVTIRQAVTDDVKCMLEFLKADDWDYSEYDYNCSLATDSKFLLAAVDSSEKPVGKIKNFLQ